MPFLKQSTTTTIKLGPFLDISDGITEETGITPVIEIAKNNGAFAARNSATAIAHDAEGWYNVELNTTDTNTLGTLTVKSQDSSTHLPVFEKFDVVKAEVYDTFFSTDNFTVDLQAATQSSIDAIETIINKLDDTLEDDGGIYRFTTNALEQGPSGTVNITSVDIESIAGYSVTKNTGQNLISFFDVANPSTSQEVGDIKKIIQAKAGS